MGHWTSIWFRTWIEAEEFDGLKDRGNYGAFGDLPPEQLPQRIPLSKFKQIADTIRTRLEPHGQVFIPDAVKKSEAKSLQDVGEFIKNTTSDVDLFFLPNDRNYKEAIKSALPVIADRSNGPQFFVVTQGLVDEGRYMLDIRICTPKEWQFITFHHGYGVILPVILGSFARSLGYRFANDGLYKRIKDARNNFHNLFLTSSPDVAMKILGLDPNVNKEDFYTPESVAQWVASSSRFDSRRWNATPDNSGTSIAVINSRSHRSAINRPEVQKTYTLLKQINKQSSVRNDNLEVERSILGNEVVEKILGELSKKAPKQADVLSGYEIMQILGIRPGPDVGKWANFLRTHPQLQGPSSPATKDLAKRILLAAANRK